MEKAFPLARTCSICAQTKNSDTAGWMRVDALFWLDMSRDAVPGRRQTRRPKQESEREEPPSSFPPCIVGTPRHMTQQPTTTKDRTTG